MSKDLFNMLCDKVGSMRKALLLWNEERSSWGKVGDCGIELQAEITAFPSKNIIGFSEKNDRQTNYGNVSLGIWQTFS